MNRFLKCVVLSVAASVAASAFANVNVLWCVDGKADGVFRFKINDGGTAEETWEEAAPAITFESPLRAYSCLPAHGCYYVCAGASASRAQIFRYTKAGVQESSLGYVNGGGNYSFALSPDQAYLYFVDTWEGRFGRMRLATGAVEFFTHSVLNTPRNLGFGADGLLYVGSRSNNGISSFDVSGATPVLKVNYRTPGYSVGNVIADTVGGRVYSVMNNNHAFSFNVVEAPVDGIAQSAYVSDMTINSAAAYAGRLIDGRAYSADYKDGSSQVWRYSVDGVSRRVATVTESSQGMSGAITKCEFITEDKFPSVDSTSAITRLTDMWSFNGSTGLSSPIGGHCQAILSDAFTTVPSGAVREGLWCAPRAEGTLTSAIIVPQSGDFSIGFFAGFPSALEAEQVLLSNPKMTVSVDAAGCPKVALSDGTSATATASIADGAWHYVGIVRRSNKLEVWVDAVKSAESAETECTIYDDIDTQWSLLDSGNTATMFFDELRFYDAALGEGDFRLLKSLATAGLKVPADPTFDHTAAEAIAPIVAHAGDSEWGFGVPTIIKDGTSLYVSVDQGREIGAQNQTTILKSEDDGESWTSAATVGFAAAALFKTPDDEEGTLRLAGIDPRNGFPWTYRTQDGGLTWTTPSKQSSTALSAMWYPSNPAAALDGYYLMSPNGPCAFDPNPAMAGLGGCTACAATISAGAGNSGFALAVGGKVYGQVPKKVLSFQSNATNTQPLQASLVFARETATAASSPYRGSFAIRGGARPFGVVLDETTGYHWAVTTYAAETESPASEANRLALYCSKSDAVDWTYCGDVLVAGTPDTVAFMNPNVTIDGDDLVVVFGASVADRAVETETRDLSKANYILSKRVAGFRSLLPEKNYRAALLLTDLTAKRLLRIWEDPVTGEFVPGGYFAESVGDPDDLKCFGGYVWLLKNRVLYKYELDGTFTGTSYSYTSIGGWPTDIGFSYDGKWIYLLDASWKGKSAENKIWKASVETGEATLLACGTDEGLYDLFWNVRTVTGLPDGSIALAARDVGTVFTLDADGALDKTLMTGLHPSVQPQLMSLDRRTGKLYVAGFGTSVCAYDLAQGTKVLKPGIPAGQLVGLDVDWKGRLFGLSYSATQNGALMLNDGKSPFDAVGYRVLTVGGNEYSRCCCVRIPGPNKGASLLLF